MTKEECKKFAENVCVWIHEGKLRFLQVRETYIPAAHIVAVSAVSNWRGVWGFEIILSTGQRLKIFAHEKINW
jgi:hypothetical protein